MTAILTDFLLIIGMTKSKTAFIFTVPKKDINLMQIKKCNKVSFCTYDKGYRKDGEWPLYINSVIVFGKISIVNDNEKIIEICKNLCYKFTDDENYVADELEKAGNRVCCLELIPEHISGKLVKES